MCRLKLLVLGLLALAAPLLLYAAAPPSSSVGPPAPPPPDLYKARIRYSIIAFADQRLPQYNEMMRYLARAGFKRDPDEDVPDHAPEDATFTRLNGTIPASGVARLINQRHVRTILLVPAGKALPEDKKAQARVDLQLLSGFAFDQQQKLHAQAGRALASLGFVPAAGYDHRNYARLLGTVPVESLETMLEDLRKSPGGAKEGAPFAKITALRIIEARPDLPPPTARPAPPAVPPAQVKLTPELRELLRDADRAARPTRMEVILADTPRPDDRSWMAPLERPGLVIEGRLGPLVTVRGAPGPLATKLAELNEVVAVRLPRAARIARPTVPARAGEWEPLRASGLARLHSLKKRGKGVHVAVVAADFRGWEMLKGRKLGKEKLLDPVLVDMTRERNTSLLPDPYPIGAEAVGAGTRYAQTILSTAPEAKLALIRIAPEAPYLLETVARAINGEAYRNLGIDQRLRGLGSERQALDERRDALLVKRRTALDMFRDTPASIKAREAYFKEQEAFDNDEKAHNQRVRRYLDHIKQVKGLKGINIVASTLVWSEGYPVDGTSALSRYFDERPFGAALWFQAAGDTRRQAWTGPFRDQDKNGFVEFAPPGARLAPGAWTHELNFLGWQSGGRIERDLPAKTRLRISLQWKEAHDPIPLKAGEDPYREPLNKMRLVLFQQPDPDGKARPADDLVVVTQSVGTPQRLTQTLHSATYEQVIELTLPAGRYAVGIEGKLADSISPPGEARLPSMRKVGEVRPRLFVETISEGSGRAVWASYFTDAGSVGMPADARRVITVGAADREGHGQPFSATGAPYGLELLARPAVLAYDEDRGTAQAACFAAGLSTVVRDLEAQPGALLRVPNDWPRRHR